MIWYDIYDMHSCSYWASWSSRFSYGTAGTEDRQDDIFDEEQFEGGDDAEAAAQPVELPYDIDDQPGY